MFKPDATAQYFTAAPASFGMPATGAISGTGLVRDGFTAWSPPTC